MLAGSWREPPWNEPAAPLDFFDGKGVVETLLDELGVRALEGARRRACRGCSPAAAPRCSSAARSSAGSARCTRACSTRSRPTRPVTAFELDARGARSRGASRREAVHATCRASRPSTLDVALVVAEDVTAERVEQAIGSAGGKLLESARLFDVYRGDGRARGRQEVMAFALTYRAPDRTLTAEEVEPVHERLVRKVCGAVGGELRQLTRGAAGHAWALSWVEYDATQ